MSENLRWRMDISASMSKKWHLMGNTDYDVIIMLHKSLQMAGGAHTILAPLNL